MESNRRAPGWTGPLIGLVSCAAALGVSLAAAGLVRASAFPVVAVGDAAVDLAPAGAKEFAIRVFGENDKNVLVAGVLVVLAAIAAAVGTLALRDLRYGTAGLAAFGVVGVSAALTRPDAGVLDAVPTLAGVVAGIVTLRLLTGRALRGPAPTTSGEGAAIDRRGLLIGAAGGLALAGVSGVIGQALTSGRSAVSAARASLRLPGPATPLPPIPAGADLRIKGLSPFVTPNADFYRVDTALVLPQVDPRSWTLRIHGMVDRPVELTFADLLKRPVVEADVTLCCVSNDVGGPYVGNARWLGADLAGVLRDAGVHRDADMLLSTSADGWTCGTPVDVVLDGRDALLAFAMNGEALPFAHGFPVRQVVPGLYGYVSATKWVTDIKVTRFDRDEAYWTPRGWAPKGPVKTESRIDLPRDGADLPAGRAVIAGVAWAQHKGIDAVEVRIDRGPWRQARLAQAPTADTWRQWVVDDWDATPGEHTIEVRATDATGYTQTAERAPVGPDGATGWHTVDVRVT
ncbi:molybdopterin-dependent oxidoreductase [Streptosporangium sp. NPDC049376]|uniref:molybdopterin-dependent oxidoreductase n=1 Tax=Streptosporangium sp. NPDC049376 TaxID=3366192 RepID=UPI003790BE72